MTLATATRATARPGFTLVELLVAVSIVAILVALTSVALTKTTESQKRATTKDQVYKLQKTLDAEYERVVQQCAAEAARKTIPQPVVDYCDGDPDRAKAVWTAMQLRRNFPDSFAEAVTPFTAIPGYQLNPQATFVGVAGVGSAAGAPDPAESAVLLYTILASKSVSGGGAMASSADDLGQQVPVTIGGRQFKAFADSWEDPTTGQRRPILFCRWFGSGYRGHPLEGEVQNQEYVGSVNQFSPNNRDPLDPRNLVLGWTTGGVPNAAKRAQMAAGLWFNGNNRTATAYSLGKDLTDPSDEIMGYRSRRFGR
jgi:prepilin-type N-terminal cleavage/methylation domain-containing protein